MRRYNIQNKIVLPFILLFTIVIFVVPLIPIALFDREYDEQFSLETQNWLQAILETSYITDSPADSEKVKIAYGADVALVNAHNIITHTTLAADWAGLDKHLKLIEVRKEIAESGRNSVLRNVTVAGKPYKVSYYQETHGHLYCLMRPMDKIAAAKRQAVFWMLGIAAVVILLVALISHLIGRNLANPIKDLVQFTRQVAGGDLEQQCAVKTHDEIGDLAIAFNQMTQDLRDLRNEVIQSERLATAGKMAASFAHEIRNPLSSMRMFAQMLRQKRDLSESRREQSMQCILEEIERIDVIVKGLMDFARPAMLELERHPPNAVLQEVLDLMEANLNHHQISLIKKFHPDLPHCLFDRDKLKQAFMNIVLNAIEAMPEGGTLEIQTTHDFKDSKQTESKESGTVCIGVIDTGVGIPPDELERLFEPFVTTKSQGTGLGLANAKRVLEQHGGEISIESTVGTGTKVSLRLPVSPAHSK